MLAAVDTEQLARDCLGPQEIPQRPDDILGIRAAPQHRGDALAGKVGLALPPAPQGYLSKRRQYRARTKRHPVGA